MNLITDHIQLNKKELSNSTISPQRKRHLKQELDSLERYRERHPDRMKDPTVFEIFCDENPDAPECRIFEV
jgi:hypothetical protein